MARLFAILSGSIPSALTSDNFDQRTISDGDTKRNALIASRSILSADVYEDLDAVNIDGSKGTYFPPNLLTAPNDPFTGTAYTSSIAGIVIPTDYRTRPTASVLSTTAGVAPTNPLDTVSVSYTSYLNASQAVKSVLDSIQGGGPYGRLGLIPSRTLHSIWHDQELRYFAWDDFTPGTGSLTTRDFGPLAGGDLYLTSSSPVSASLGWIGEYSADTLGAVDVHARLAYADGENITSSNFALSAGTTTQTWNLTAANFNNASGSNPNQITLTASIKFYDVTIPTNAGSPHTQSFTSVIGVQRLFTVDAGTVYMATGSDVTQCYPVTQPLYSTFLDAWPGDNPNATSFGLGAKVYSDITPGASPPNGFDPGLSLPNHNAGGPFWMVYVGAGNIPGPTYDICEYTDGILDVSSCTQAPVCYTTTTTTTTTTGVCTTYNYISVGSLTACNAGAYDATFASNTGITIGSRLYSTEAGTCQFGLSPAGFVQIENPANASQRLNLQYNSTGYIIDIYTVNC